MTFKQLSMIFFAGCLLALAAHVAALGVVMDAEAGKLGEQRFLFEQFLASMMTTGAMVIMVYTCNNHKPQ